QSEVTTAVTAAALAHLQGVPVTWPALLGETAARTAELPTYPFQRQRYWLDPVSGAANADELGLNATDHPLLGAALQLAHDERQVFTSSLSLRSHPWLADHALHGTVILPGTAQVELAVRAGEQAGYPDLAELTMTAPLVLPERGSAQVQVVVAADTGDGDRRTVQVYSRADEAQPWTLHAEGLLMPEGGDAPPQAPAAWPPSGFEEVALDGTYERLAGLGYAYGPAFQGLRRVWRDPASGDVCAEVALPEELRAEAGRFVLHPALLDAALHPLLPGVTDEERPALVPFSWSGVSVRAAGATSLRVRITAAGPETVSLTVADGTGAPVAEVESLLLRPLSADAVRQAGREGLLRVEWSPLADAAVGDTAWGVLDEGGLDALAAGGTVP
ncbi:polyketide synthase dehydratase domain-containing protein, partial [Streptomyces sp. TRM 70351]|uniref:polyketide synthase dehydratase domain-containing protein n=1 Tax=Streptomyces sp. TRM 70351 TaxID=3116552 RepID=UPI002E7B7046